MSNTTSPVTPDRTLLLALSITEQVTNHARPDARMQALLDAGYATRTQRGYAITPAGRAYLASTRKPA